MERFCQESAAPLGFFLELRKMFNGIMAQVGRRTHGIFSSLRVRSQAVVGKLDHMDAVALELLNLKQQQKALKQQRRRRHEPLALSPATLATGLLMLWCTKGSQDHLKQYLEHKLAEQVRRRKLSAQERLRVEPLALTNGIRASTVVDEWVRKVVQAWGDWSLDDDLNAIFPEGVTKRRLAQATSFVESLHLKDWVVSQNQKALAPSVLATRRALSQIVTEGLTSETDNDPEVHHRRSRRLKQRVQRWVRRFQVHRGSFKLGPGLSLAAARHKVPVDINIIIFPSTCLEPCVSEKTHPHFHFNGPIFVPRKWALKL